MIKGKMYERTATHKKRNRDLLWAQDQGGETTIIMKKKIQVPSLKVGRLKGESNGRTAEQKLRLSGNDVKERG